ncbi:hypothetical protein [Actinophytocola sp.]|uniref:hypothetical protein n=1 Tax=Actinophytocola sp. TaxID=1872138 RepID=UPI0025BC3FB5|nr:hypothetical protein [Actinophytocola sp.]
MLWLTWRQHRLQVLVTAMALLGAGAFLLAAKSADLSAYKPAQVIEAVEVIDLAAITRASRPAAWVAVSSRGDAVYDVDGRARTCTCPAGETGSALLSRLLTSSRRPDATPAAMVAAYEFEVQWVWTPRGSPAAGLSAHTRHSGRPRSTLSG